MTIKNGTKLQITPIDKAAQEEGTWTKYHSVWLKIARSTSKGFRKAVQEIRDKYGPEEVLTEDQNLDNLAESMSSTMLLDWQGFEIQDPDSDDPDEMVEVPYTKENAFDLLRYDDDVRAFIVAFANDKSNFYHDRVRKTAGK